MYRESFQTTPKARSACSDPTIGFLVCRQAEAWLRRPKRDFKKGGADGMGGQRRDTSPCYRKTIHMSAPKECDRRSSGPNARRRSLLTRSRFERPSRGSTTPRLLVPPTRHRFIVSSGRINRSNGQSDCLSPVVSPPPGRHELPETDMAIWWRAGESNPRPLRCERSALPTELAPHLWEPATRTERNPQGLLRISAQTVCCGRRTGRKNRSRPR
jgi:hypothetical protein